MADFAILNMGLPSLGIKELHSATLNSEKMSRIPSFSKAET